MAEATISESQAMDAAQLEKAARQVDFARIRRIGSYHFAMAMGALTIWGAAVTWAQVTGWAIAQFAAVGGALVAGMILPSIIHEWGHFAGARLSGAQSPALEKPRNHYFMFDFAMDQNDARQFIWMSWGGILAPWVLVVGAWVFVPWALTSGLVLIATLMSRAVAVTVFEAPIAQAVSQGGDPGTELGRQVKDGALSRAGLVGNVSGWLIFAALWVVL